MSSSSIPEDKLCIQKAERADCIVEGYRVSIQPQGFKLPRFLMLRKETSITTWIMNTFNTPPHQLCVNEMIDIGDVFTQHFTTKDSVKENTKRFVFSDIQCSVPMKHAI